MTEPTDSAPVPPASVFTYDSKGRLASCVHPDGTTTTYTWHDDEGPAGV
ncbi:MAG: hypothetical protein K8I02_08535 [Candidatus Methylomirabilis sp.]|nr:hypothetical protein [Deltaproteobacteria bacterium]